MAAREQALLRRACAWATTPAHPQIRVTDQRYGHETGTLGSLSSCPSGG